jgi:TPR repeat protein
VPAAASGIAPQAELRGKPASSAGAAQQPASSRQAALQAPALADPAKGAPRTEIVDLIREGNKRMKEGDILEARRFYQKAVALGDPEAALAMGRSYDPIYFARIDRKNAEPDAAKAFDWYRKAMDGGASQTAKVRIENLKHFLNQ